MQPGGLLRPVVIGLTGGIGSGKSAVLKVMVQLGAEGVDADRVAHEVMARGGPAYRPILSAFGHGIVTADGEIDRAALARLVFGDAGALRRLEAITHPAVAEVVKARVRRLHAPVVVIEADQAAGGGAQPCLMRPGVGHLAPPRTADGAPDRRSGHVARRGPAAALPRRCRPP